MKFEKGSLADTRRKLMRGSVAAPLLLTLRPGTAAAASATACIARNAANPPAAASTGLVGSPDTMFRKSVELFKVKLKSDDPSNDKFVDCFKFGNEYRSQADGSFFVAVGGEKNAISQGNGYVLVYVNPDGSLAGVFSDRKAGAAISVSCWTSIPVKPVVG